MYYYIRNLNFYNLSFYNIQNIDYLFYLNIEKFINKNKLINIIKNIDFSKYKQNFISNQKAIDLIINDYIDDKLDITGFIFSIDGEYENIPLNIFQKIFNDINSILKKKLLLRKFTFNIKIILILLKLNKYSKKKIYNRLKNLYP